MLLRYQFFINLFSILVLLSNIILSQTADRKLGLEIAGEKKSSLLAITGWHLCGEQNSITHPEIEPDRSLEKLTSEQDTIGSERITEICASGLSRLVVNDTLSAVELFKESVSDYSDALSYFKLGEIFSKKSEIESKLKGRRYFREAIDAEPDNLKYRYELALLLEELAKLEPTDIFSREEAIDQYRAIIEYDSMHFNANMRLGILREIDFNEFNNSFMKNSITPLIDYSDFSAERYVEHTIAKFNNANSPMLSYETIAESFFEEAELSFRRAIESDPSSKEARKHLCFLYIDNKSPEKGIPLLESIAESYSNDKDVHLYLGLLYYQSSQNDEAFTEYQKAIKLMSKEERDDITYNSVLEIIKPILGDVMANLSSEELKKCIEVYWRAKDPLELTNYNERLLEHYSRVVYANLRFSVPEMNIIGWKTDRGEMFFRYGQPLGVTVLRPWIILGDFEIRDKTEIWYYDRFTLAFVDDLMNGNMRFSTPTSGVHKSQYAGDTQLMVEGGLRKSQPEKYIPKFEGPIFDIPYYTVQFKNLLNNETEVYVNYGIDLVDSISLSETVNQNYQVGLFFFDKFFNKRYEKLELIDQLNFGPDQTTSIHSIKMNVLPDSGNMAFEMIRENDKGVASYHSKFQIKDFGTSELHVSDIILATDVTTENQSNYPVHRNQYSILPNPAKSFSDEIPIYIYYEIYNLGIGTDKLTDFEQEITIKRKNDEGNIFDDILDLIGLTGDEIDVTMKSSYKTLEHEPQVYLQLNLSDYEPGIYLIEISISDVVSNREAVTNTMLLWE